MTPELAKAFARYTAQDSMRNAKVACVLVILLMPAGYILDYFVYYDLRWDFFQLRLACSCLTGLVLIGLRQPGLSPVHYRVLSAGWYLIPAFFISWMIAVTEGVSSPYYAGLNLVILAVSSVIQATLLESMVAVGLIVLMYIGACSWHSALPDKKSLVNNAYFTFCTAVIVLTGNYFYNRLRFREFSLRYELNENRKKLEESNQKLIELDQIKSRFFANISHELRTPLTLLVGPLETLLERFQGNLDTEARSLLQTMHANGMRLLKLINDLLDLVRLESGRMEVRQEPVDISPMINGLACSVRQAALQKKVDLQTSCDPKIGLVAGDRDKFEKILLNLLFNAMKFTPSGGRIELLAEKVDDQLVMTVRDTGMGISEKNLPFIFDRFWQADSSSQRKFQGAGIGLSLVKELVEIQGGTVQVESQEGKGTTFVLRFPYVPASSARKTGGTPDHLDLPEVPDGEVVDQQSDEWLTNLYRRAQFFAALGTTPANRGSVPLRQGSLPVLLVADDEPDMRSFLTSQLAGKYQVIEAVDGAEAFEMALQSQPDIILLDMMMPQKDGLQVCRELRAQPSGRNVPIILLTARADEETKLQALSAGASDFLAKPFSTTELHVRIKNLVDSHQFQRTLGRQNEQLEATIEQLKQTESQLVQTEKLASLGRMSAGIIHEINNPLNFATTGLFTLRNKSRYLAEEQRPEFVEILKDVEEGITRVKNIVRDLRTFTQPSVESIDEVEVKEVVQGALRFVSHEMRDHIDVRESYPEHFKVRGNHHRFIQVFVNLLQNSVDAIKSKKYAGETPLIEITAKAEAGRHLVVIRDNGSGIDPSNIDKIFDPFFTTKEVGQGMGLGLSVCYRIVQEYEGQIRVSSEPGKYCEFILDFPAVKTNAAAAA